MRWMVTLTFDPAQGDKIGPLIPAEQARVAELRQEGKLEAIYISQGNQVWLILRAATEGDVHAILDTLPLHPYARSDVAALRD
jgi:muconolactone delta-isomerase